MKHFPRQPRAGFTLIELALAALLVGIGLLALIALGRNAIRAAMEAEDELRATALAGDIFTTLRAASSEAYQTYGREGWVEFWNSVTNSEPERISVLFENMNVKGLAHPASAGVDGKGFLHNAMADDEKFTLPFYPAKDTTTAHVYRPASPEATFWETRYKIKVAMTNLLCASFPELNLQPDLAQVTLSVFPRTTYLQFNDDDGSSYRYMDPLTFSTFIPLETLRDTLFNEKRRELP